MKITLNWTESDNKIIKDNFNKLTLRQIMCLIPHITTNYYSFRSHCHSLGLYRDRNIKLPNKNTYNQEYFKNVNIISSFLSGRIASDGCIFLDERYNTYVFSYFVSQKDEIIIDQFIKELNYTGKKQIRDNFRFNMDTKLVGISVNSFNKNAEFLKQYYNLTPNKTKRIGPTNLDNLYLNLSYIIGAWDGDGTIAARNYSYTNSIYMTLCSSSIDILNWVKSLFDKIFPNELFSKNKISEILLQKQCYRYTISGLRAAIIIDYLSQFPVPMLERKWKNEKVWDFINKKKLEFPHLFKTLNLDDIKDLLPKDENNLSHSPNMSVNT